MWMKAWIRLLEYHGERVSDKDGTSHSEGRQIGAVTTEVDQVEQEQNDECEADWDREDKSLIQFKLRRVRGGGWAVIFWVWSTVRHHSHRVKNNTMSKVAKSNHLLMAEETRDRRDSRSELKTFILCLYVREREMWQSFQVKHLAFSRWQIKMWELIGF